MARIVTEFVSQDDWQEYRASVRRLGGFIVQSSPVGGGFQVQVRW